MLLRYRTKNTAKPTNAPAAGKTGWIVVDGITYVWDEARTSWLSVERVVVTFAINDNNVLTRVMDLMGSIPGKKAGIILPRAATLVEMVADSTNAMSGDFSVRTKAVSGTEIVKLTLAAATSGKKLDFNQTFSADDVPIVKLVVASGNADYPVCKLTFAHRLA